MDPRLTPMNDRVAAEALRGRVEDVTFVEGTHEQVTWPVLDLLDAPEGRRARQLLFGDTVDVYESRAGWAFVQARRDGYVGYVQHSALAEPEIPTHWVSATATHLYDSPDIKARDLMSLSLGSLVRVSAIEGAFAATSQGYVPMWHLRSTSQRAPEPAAIAEQFLGTPYLWGGNSRLGLDCSGLVQAAWLACGLPCPGDSDMQATMPGAALDAGTDLRRNDLLFWKGHVAIVTGEDRLIHANAHHMAVAHEGVGEAIARIASQGDGPVTSRLRPEGGAQTEG
ncbi:Cell wall-associated hydrolase, NlpC family [Salinihabitans flavidus]|uniref:Cell wall-associated hydrolase, NlpC family n=1 Tax=Salinihabitans flavidus TaxID=569882 RepID=A0A1H8LH99_9RHOB|nr:Cell wall-associated hydrolase, NlpC family [Salinihabitans flavidus]